MATRATNVAAVVFGGSASGLLAGLAMAITAMVYATATDMGAWLPVRQVAALWYGVDALIGGDGMVMVGVLTHLIVAMGWGVVFAALTSRRSGVGVSLVAGLAFGTILWALMTFVVLPLVNPVMYERTRLIPVVWYALHLVYGGFLLVTPALERLIAGMPKQATA